MQLSATRSVTNLDVEVLHHQSRFKCVFRGMDDSYDLLCGESPGDAFLLQTAYMSTLFDSQCLTASSLLLLLWCLWLRASLGGAVYLVVVLGLIGITVEPCQRSGLRRVF